MSKLVFDLEIRGMGNIPQGEGFVAILPHKYVNDVPLLISALRDRQLTFWVETDCFRPDLIPFIRQYVFSPGNEGSRTATLKSYRKVLGLLVSGRALVSFSEDSEGGWKEAGRNAFRLAERADVPIIPLNIEFERSREGDSGKSIPLSRFFSRAGVSIEIGKPLRANQLDLAEGRSPENR